MLTFVVLPTVNFDNDMRSEMHEVGDVRADGLLTTEFLAVQTMRPQMTPEQSFCIGHLLPQSLGEVPCFHQPLSPTPLPQGERG